MRESENMTLPEIAIKRHVKGSDLLYFDTHVVIKKTRLITVNDWRDRR